MHFLPDTEDEDSTAETFWPEGYKQVIREDIRQMILGRLGDGRKLKHAYRQKYNEKFSELMQFTEKIADMIAIGAENGADNAFDDIMNAFLTEAPLPEKRSYARYLWPQIFPRKAREVLGQAVTDEYSQDEVYSHAHRVGYGCEATESANQGSYPGFDQFISHVAGFVVTGAMNGADDMLGAIYGALADLHPLPTARRHPRRLKTWAIPEQED